MKNSFNSITFLAFVALMLAFVTPAMAATINGADDTIAPPTVVTPSGQNTSTPATTNGADDTVAPPANAPTTGSSGSVAQTTNGADDAPTTPTTPATPPVTSSGGSYYSGGSSGGGRSFLASAVSTVTPTVTLVSTTSCPLITDYLKLGGNNNPAQVTNLQIFLKNSEKLGVDVNGTFDQKTEDAVKSFQLKYLPSILGPWDATRATGFVYITTTKKINELACASPIVLYAEEQAIIAAYKARGVVVEQPSETVAPANSNATGTLEVGTNDNGQAADNTAAVGGASILSRFWDFIVNLFR